MELKDLTKEYDKLQKKYGAKELDSIYNGGCSEKPDICFVFMNPTGRNIASKKEWKGLKSPWIGTKNIWDLFYALDLVEEGIYKKIKSTLRLLDYESYLFWDELFSNFKGLDIRKELFEFDENKTDVIIGCNPYLQSDILYDITKTKIKKTKFEFITDDVFKTSIDKQFDSIWLSNIGTHISRHFLKIMIDNMSKKLNDNGLLLISYLYKTVRDTPYQQDWSPIYNLEKTFEILQEYNPQLISFIGVDGIKFSDSTINDSILVYRKSKY